MAEVTSSVDGSLTVVCLNAEEVRALRILFSDRNETHGIALALHDLWEAVK